MEAKPDEGASALATSRRNSVTQVSIDVANAAQTEQRKRADLLLPDKPLIAIESEEYGVQLNLDELWSRRELLYILMLRDIKVRYKQTVLGGVWVIIQPLFSMLLFTLVFNKFGGLDAGAVPYPLFAYTGLLIWSFFSTAILSSTTSLISNVNLITKVYFPRMLIPAAAVGAGLVDLVVASVILIFLAIYYQLSFTPALLLAPLFILLAILLSLSVGMLISALTVKYRDLRHALPFVLQFWMFASPIIYPAHKIKGVWHWILLLNPLTGILEGFRAAIIGGGFEFKAIAISSLMTLGLLVSSVYIFRRAEDTFADLV